METPNTTDFQSTSLGETHSCEYEITDNLYCGFLKLFGDVNPLHCDSSYAQAAGFRGCVMHGAILQGFLSHFVGMVFPGKWAILLGTDFRFHAPSYLGDKVRFDAVVAQRLENERVLVLNVTVFNLSQEAVVVRGKVKVGFVKHG